MIDFIVNHIEPILIIILVMAIAIEILNYKSK